MSHTLTCSECKRLPRPDENPLDEWRVYPYGLRELYLFCPECAEREFADDAPGSGEQRAGRLGGVGLPTDP